MNINPNEKTSQSQNAAILAHLQAGHRITSLESLNLFGCLRLSARILDLRERGHTIKSQTVMRHGKRVSEYWLAE